MLEILRLFAEFDIQDCLWWHFPSGPNEPEFLIKCNDLFYWATADAEEPKTPPAAPLDAGERLPTASTWP